MNLKLLVSSQILLSLVLSSCYSPRPYQPDYMVNAATVCDHDYRTPTLSDDCEYVSGYYYHPGSYHLYWRPVGRPAVVVYDNYRFSNTTTYTAGSSVRLNQPIATSVSGQPVRDKNGAVRTAPVGKDYNKTPLSSNAKQSSSYKPTLAKPTTSSPPKAANANSNGTTGSVKAGSMTKPNGAKASGSASGSSSSSTPAKASSSTAKPATTSTSPVRSNSSSSFSKPSANSSSSNSSSANSSPSNSSSGSKASSSSKSSGSVRGGSFGSSKSSGG